MIKRVVKYLVAARNDHHSAGSRPRKPSPVGIGRVRYGGLLFDGGPIAIFEGKAGDDLAIADDDFATLIVELATTNDDLLTPRLGFKDDNPLVFAFEGSVVVFTHFAGHKAAVLF